MIAVEATVEEMLPHESSRLLDIKDDTHVRPIRLERVVLTGFMGAGKTTVGALLAKRLGWTFRDLDAEVERRCGITVPQMFAQFGEAHFRRQEAAALASVLGGTRTVIALGGGAAEELGNRLLLEQTPRTAVVLLHAPFETLYQRCLAQAALPGTTARPNIADRQKAEVRFAARQRSYSRIASHSLDTAQLSAEEAAEAILGELCSASKAVRA